MKKSAPVVFLLGTALIVYLLVSRPASSPAPAGAAKSAPDLVGAAPGGQLISLSDYAGKVVLVDFWATWCDPCKAEIPELIKLNKSLGAKGFMVLGVSMDEEKDAVPPFAKKFGIDYPLILLGTEMTPTGWVVPGLPTAYLIGRDGKVLKRYFGSKNAEDLAADIGAALAK